LRESYKDSWRANRPSRCSSTGYTPRCLPRRIERTSNPEDLGTNGWNEKQELTTVVLIHGLWMTPLSWEHWVARYQGQGLRVIAPGYPGIKPGRGRGRAQIQNQQEHTALKPAKASAVAGSWAFRGVFWICRHLDRGGSVIAAQGSRTEARLQAASVWLVVTRDVAVGVASRFADGNTEDDGATAVP
jgi:hypothetical protein